MQHELYLHNLQCKLLTSGVAQQDDHQHHHHDNQRQNMIQAGVVIRISQNVPTHG